MIVDIDEAMYVPYFNFPYRFLTYRLFSLEEQQLSKSGTHGPHTLSKREIAAMSPHLGILNNIPLAIAFEVRVSIF